MLPSLEYTNTLANGVMQYTKDADRKLENNMAIETSKIRAEMKDNIPNWKQNDLNGNGYIKNRPFYESKKTRLRNTYEDWIAAGGSDTSDSGPTLSFIVNDEIFENITPLSYQSGTVAVYNLPTNKNNKYQIVIHKSSGKIDCNISNSGGESIENWSIYPPEEKTEIRYLDSKYIEDMYYTEKGPFVEELGNTYEAWLSIVGSGDYTSDTKKMAVSIKVNENIYENVIPRYFSDSRVWVYEPTSEIQIVTQPSSGQVMSSLPSLDGVSFVTISKEDRVHKIPEKYYDKNGTFVFDLTQDSNGTWVTSRTWEEIKEVAFRKGTSASAFSADLDGMNAPCVFSEKNGLEYHFIFALNFAEFTIADTPIESQLVALPGQSTSVFAMVTANEDGVSVINCTIGGLSYPTLAYINVTMNTHGGLSCIPSNAYSFCVKELKMPTYKVFCPLYYKGNIYNLESVDTNSTSIYFSGVADGSYRRIKITQGADGLDDTVVMDKVIELENSSLILNSSTADSTKKFKITVDDSGTLSAIEITESTT